MVANACDRGNVADEIEIELVIEHGIGCVSGICKKERVAVCGRFHNGFGSEIGASARTVLDNEWPAELIRKPLADQACDDVVAATGSRGDNDAHRLGRIGL